MIERTKLTTWMLCRTQYAPVRIAFAKRALIAKLPREIPFSRITHLFEFEISRELSGPPSYRRVAAEIPERDGIARGG